MATIADIGGEHAFLRRLLKSPDIPRVIVGNGDDACVLEVGDSILAVSTDSIVDGDHFSVNYFTPQQIGSKAIESAASDIIAMGGTPLYIFISLCLPKGTEVEFLEGVYEGMQLSCKRLGAFILGGDTTHGDLLLVSVTVLGEIQTKDNICTRRGANVGDLIYVTGDLGGSFAGLRLFRNGIEGYEMVKSCHLNPQCRIDIVDAVSDIATSAIDISDGLASELHHICRSSGVGAIIEAESIPVRGEVREVADHFGDDPVDYALFGGEDFELLYTVPKDLESRAIGVKLGFVTDTDVLIQRGTTKERLPDRGYDHFRDE